MKILVVDDEKDVKVLFEQKFRKEIRSGAIDFNFAYSGEEALGFMNGHKHEAVLILSDINMPGMSGLELLRNIRGREFVPQPLVMIITAYGDEENRSTARALGSDGFLTKPLDFSELKDKLLQLGS